MTTQDSAHPRVPEVTCLVCHSYARPWDVPWPQHAVGCRVRTAQLSRELELRRTGTPGSRLAAA